MKYRFLWVAILAISLLSCKSKYQITEMRGSIVEMDSTFDVYKHPKMHNLVHSYKVKLDKEMNEVIGLSAQFMDYKRPESLLTNLTSDVMKKYGDEHLKGGTIIGVMNVHGHRATLHEGAVTMGNIFEIYSFDNTITFLELKGGDLKRIFDSYARIGGAGISSNVKLVIKDSKVKSVTIDGENIDDDKTYNIVTLDYLADGNDNMGAFRDALSINNTGITLRDLMIDWIMEETRRGNKIESALDGRITVEK